MVATLCPSTGVTIAHGLKTFFTEPALRDLPAMLCQVALSMDLGESQLHSFIIKLWLEDSLAAKQTEWRGQITHVPGGEHRYIKNFDEMAEFISVHLNWTTLETPPHGWWRKWIGRLRWHG